MNIYFNLNQWSHEKIISQMIANRWLQNIIVCEIGNAKSILASKLHPNLEF